MLSLDSMPEGYRVMALSGGGNEVRRKSRLKARLWNNINFSSYFLDIAKCMRKGLNQTLAEDVESLTKGDNALV
jgi:hypothetical protein